jgi:hypothetical protein
VADLAQYGYVYNTSAQTVAVGAAITFDSNGVMTGGIAHTAGSAGVTLTQAGTYAITFSVSGAEPNQMGIFVNGASVPGTIYASGGATAQNVGQAILTVTANTVITVVNHTSAGTVDLAQPIGGSALSTNASIVIEEIS